METNQGEGGETGGGGKEEMELPRGAGGVSIEGGRLWVSEGKGKRGAGLGERARLRGGEERGRVGMKRDMERREGGLDGPEMETSGWTYIGVGGMMAQPGRDVRGGKQGRQRERNVIHEHLLKQKYIYALLIAARKTFDSLYRWLGAHFLH